MQVIDIELLAENSAGNRRLEEIILFVISVIHIIAFGNVVYVRFSELYKVVLNIEI